MSGWPPADFARSHFTARLSNIDLSISAFREVRWKAHRFKPSSADWVALVNPNSNAVQTVFQLDTSGGSFEQIFQTRIQCCVKIGHSTVIQATDGNLWVTNPNAQPWGTVYTITPMGTLLQTLAFSGSTNGAAPHFLLQASSGVIYGTTYNRGPGGAGTVFSMR
jgi:hypothetical protein